MIGAKIRQIRRQKGISATNLAKEIGLPLTTLSSIEREVIKNPSFYTICKIAKVLEVPIEYFAEQFKEADNDY